MQNRLMKIVFLVLAALLMPQVVKASICAGGTYDTYISQGSCTIDDKVFSLFGISSTATGGATAMTASGVFVTPITTPGDEGLQFSAGWNVSNVLGGSQGLDTLLTFSVGGLYITDLGLFFNGSVNGSGTSGVTEQFCLGGSLQNCGQNGSQLVVTNPPPNFNQDIVFGPVTFVSVSKDIHVNVAAMSIGQQVSNADISHVINTFSSEVPEPMTLSLIGGGLLAFGIVGLRRRRLKNSV